MAAKDDQITGIAVSLRDTWGVRYIAPVHCTGEPAFAILKEAFGEHYVYAGLGTTVLLGPKVTVKAEAGQLNKEAMDEEDFQSYREAMVRGPLRALLGKDRRLLRAQQQSAFASAMTRRPAAAAPLIWGKALAEDQAPNRDQRDL